MLTLPEIKERLSDRNLMEVSRRSGISYQCVYNLMKDRTDPKYNTVKALSDYLKGVEA